MTLLSGWGRHPVAECRVFYPATVPELQALLASTFGTIARGNGRSYGDASLNTDATIDTRSLNRFLAFDETSGRLVCEAGLLLSEVIDVLLPRGWFPAVVPGTKFVTIGGMIASDVHGKNHHVAGSFCDHVEWIDLAGPDGGIARCSRAEHRTLFDATCGGMGLTGVIVRACIRLLKVETSAIRQRTIRTRNLEQTLEVFDEFLDSTYSVAWIDCTTGGARRGRSAVFLGEHARGDELPSHRRAAPFQQRKRRQRRVPLELPSWTLGKQTVRLFNRAYYAAQKPGETILDLDQFFFPLDSIHDWNRIYGRAGLLQYQCVLPLEAGKDGVSRLLGAIVEAGEASPLAVLKRLRRQSAGLISFPMNGYTLAVDFRATQANLALLDRLDAVTTDHGGRVYLTKDARLSVSSLEAGYPALHEFREVRSQHGLDQRFLSLLSTRLGI